MRQHEALALSIDREIVADAFDQRFELKGLFPMWHDARIEARDIQQRTEQGIERFDRAGDLFDQPLTAGIELALAQRADKHRERMHRLAQVVACGGEKARFRLVGLDGEFLLRAEVANEVALFDVQSQRLGQGTVRAPREQQHGENICDREPAEGEVEIVAAQYCDDQQRNRQRQEIGEHRRQEAAQRQHAAGA